MNNFILNGDYTVIDSKLLCPGSTDIEQLVRCKNGKYHIIILDEEGYMYYQNPINGTPLIDLHGNKITIEEENMNATKITSIDHIISSISIKENIDRKYLSNAMANALINSSEKATHCNGGIYFLCDKNNKNIIYSCIDLKIIDVFRISEEDREKFLMEIKNNKEKDAVQPEVEKEHSDNLFEAFTRKSRLRKLLKEMEKSKTPEEGYDLLVEFIDDDYEQDGSIKYKGVRIKYFVVYDKSSNGEVKLDVKIIDLKDQNPQPVLAITVRFNRESVSRVYNGIKKLVELSS